MRNQPAMFMVLVWVSCCALAHAGGQPLTSSQEGSVSSTAAPASQPKVSTFEIDRDRQEFTLSPDVRLSVTSSYGTVQILPGGPEVVLETAIYALGTDADDARVRAADLSVKSANDPQSGLAISVVSPRDCSEVRADLVLHAPPGTPVEVDVGPGTVTVTRRDGPITVRSGIGDVWVAGCSGLLSVESEYGDVTVQSPGDAVAVGTAGGNVQVTDSVGPLVVRTMGGRITVSDVRSEDMDLSTMSGDISVGLAEPFSGKLRARTTEGKIAVTLVQGSDCRVRIGTRWGDIRNELVAVDSSYQGTNTDGRLGAGKGLVDLATSLGDITLTSVGDE